MAATEPYVRNQLYSIPLAIKPSKAEGFVATLATTEDEIADLDLESLSALEKNNVIKAVDSLRQTINAFFGQVGQ